MDSSGASTRGDAAASQQGILAAIARARVADKRMQLAESLGD
ncbi:MAG: hypothetical protein QG597_5209, partial [Actinomycetota bacterium]|nr:hypothetical protein [Actinomycetota bacterium]